MYWCVYGRYSAGRGASHHPTRAGHMLRGEAIVWVYALSILDAVYMLEQDLVDAKNSAESLVTSKCVYELVVSVYTLMVLMIYIPYRVPRALERTVSKALDRRRKTEVLQWFSAL